MDQQRNNLLPNGPLTVGLGRSRVCELPPPPEYADMLLTELMLPPMPLAGIDMFLTLSRMI